MSDPTSPPGADPGATLRLRVVFGPGDRFGPGKADLLEAIAAEGSLAGAGRRLGMSYRRAWTLVEQLNAGFAAPPVALTRGGATGGGARLTDTGVALLTLYRRLEARAREAGAEEIAAIAALRAPSAGD